MFEKWINLKFIYGVDILNEIKIFENKELGELNVLNSAEHGPLFIGHEVAEMAGYKAPRDAINYMADKFKVKLSYEQAKQLFSNSKISDAKINSQGLTMVNEAGLYKLATGKNEDFENWVFFEVLPSIRKTGKYESEIEDANALTARLIQTMTKNLEQLTGIKTSEMAIIQQESYNKRLSNLMIDCSRNGMGSMRELYDELFYLFSIEIGFDIDEIAKNMELSRMQYIRKNPSIARTLYEFAYSHFTRNERQVFLVPLDQTQRSLDTFIGEV